MMESRKTVRESVLNRVAGTVKAAVFGLRDEPRTTVTGPTFEALLCSCVPFYFMICCVWVSSWRIVPIRLIIGIPVAGLAINKAPVLTEQARMALKRLIRSGLS